MPEIARARAADPGAGRELMRLPAERVVAAVAGVPAEVVGGIERQKGLTRPAVRRETLDGGDGEYLEVERPHPVGHDHVLGVARLDVDPVAAFREQVDRRR